MLKEALEEYFRIRMNQWNMLAESLTLQGMDLSLDSPKDKELYERYMCKRDDVQLVLETIAEYSNGITVLNKQKDNLSHRIFGR